MKLTRMIAKTLFFPFEVPLLASKEKKENKSAKKKVASKIDFSKKQMERLI